MFLARYSIHNTRCALEEENLPLGGTVCGIMPEKGMGKHYSTGEIIEYTPKSVIHSASAPSNIVVHRWSSALSIRSRSPGCDYRYSTVLRAYTPICVGQSHLAKSSQTSRNFRKAESKKLGCTRQFTEFSLICFVQKIIKSNTWTIMVEHNVTIQIHEF